MFFALSIGVFSDLAYTEYNDLFQNKDALQYALKIDLG